MNRTLEFGSHPANLSIVRKFVRNFLEENFVQATEADLIVLGVDEACTNVIRHAYKHEQSQLIVLSCELTGDGVCFRIRDFATRAEAPKLAGRPLDVVSPGGLGMHLIRSAFDSVDHSSTETGNELVLTKRAAVSPERS
jgi:anti-sigma regulatory factor (Ser/Thr protein kinase)